MRSFEEAKCINTLKKCGNIYRTAPNGKHREGNIRTHKYSNITATVGRSADHKEKKNKKKKTGTGKHKSVTTTGTQ